MVPPRLIMVRHGESTANAGARSESPSGTLLTKLGHRQAQEVSHEVLARMPEPDVVAVSPFVRTQQTASPFLRRISGSGWVWPIQEWIFLNPERYVGTTNEERKGDVAAYVARGDPYFDDEGKGESFFTFIHRIDFFLISARSWGNVVAFTHGRFIRGVLWRLANPEGFILSQRDFHSFWKFSDGTEVDNCAIYDLRYREGRWTQG